MDHLRSFDFSALNLKPVVYITRTTLVHGWSFESVDHIPELAEKH